MGSPITFSGFSQIDWNVVLNAVMAQERQPSEYLQTQKRTLETQNTAIGTLLSKLNTLDSAIGALGTTTSVTPTKVTSSSANVEVSAGTGATEGTYSIVVSQLARAQVMASSSTFDSLDAEVATGGTITLASGDADPVTVTLSGTTTLSELASAINATEDIPVSASVVQTTPGSYQLVLTGRDTGADHAFTVSTSLTGGLGLAFTDTDGDNTAGDSVADLVQTARNASFTVNGLPVETASNVASEVVPGATLTLKKQDSAETVTVAVSRDDDASTGRLQKFMDAYNDVVQFMKDQDSLALAGKPNLARDPMLRALRNNLRSALQAVHPEGGTFTQLAQIGVGFDRAGKLILDRSVYTTAVAAATSDVQTLLSGTDGETGVFGALAAQLANYTQTGGQISLARDRISDQVKGLTQRLDSFEQRLAVRRASLQKTFLEAERLMSQLNSQGSSLGQLGSQFQSF